jgi:hypothetical protein
MKISNSESKVRLESLQQYLNKIEFSQEKNDENLNQVNLLLTQSNENFKKLEEKVSIERQNFTIKAESYENSIETLLVTLRKFEIDNKNFNEEINMLKAQKPKAGYTYSEEY